MDKNYKMVTVGGSLSIGSESFYDFSCTSCYKDGTHFRAVRYCVDCMERFCSSCLIDTHKFEIMRHHDLLDEAGMNDLGPKSFPTLPRHKCTLHHGKALEMYCGTHDFVYCIVCIALDHRSCTGVDYVPKVAKDITKSQEFEEVTARINSLEQNLQMMKKGRNLDSCEIEKRKKKIQASIADYRELINNLLDHLEKSSTKELDKCFKKEEDRIKDDLSSLDKCLSNVRQQVQNLSPAKDVNDSQLFINMKEAKQSIPEGEVLICNVEKSLGTKTLAFSMNTNIAKCIRKFTSLGKIAKQRKKQSATPVSHFSVFSKSDKITRTITNTCFMLDDSIVIIDDSNKKLKLFDKSYKIITERTLSSSPYAVCRTGPTEVAITLPDDKKVQFASINDNKKNLTKSSLAGVNCRCNAVNKMIFTGARARYIYYRGIAAIAYNKITITKSFLVQAKCRGIAYNNGSLYVAGGGNFGEGPGKVLVYDKVGTLLQTFLNDSNNKQMFSCPHHIVVSLCGTKLHIADWKKGIITLDTQGHKLQAFTDSELKYCTSLCVTQSGSIITCGLDSDNMILIDTDGKKQVILLNTRDQGLHKFRAFRTSRDVLLQPESVSYDIRNNRLLVTMKKCGRIFVYKLD